MKKMPAPKPYMASVSPITELICSLAKATLTRSMLAIV